MGMGIGAAMTGLRPIVEGMNMGFLLLAYNQISNNAGMLHYTSGGQYKVRILRFRPIPRACCNTGPDLEQRGAGGVSLQRAPSCLWARIVLRQPPGRPQGRGWPAGIFIGLRQAPAAICWPRGAGGQLGARRTANAGLQAQHSSNKSVN